MTDQPGGPSTDQPTTADLQAQLAEPAERERAVGEILRAMSGSGFDLVELLQTVIESAVRLSHAEFGNIARLNPATGRYQQAVFFGDVSPEFWAALNAIEFEPGRSTLIGRTLLERRPVQIEDVLADPEYRFPEAQRAGASRATSWVWGLASRRATRPLDESASRAATTTEPSAMSSSSHLA